MDLKKSDLPAVVTLICTGEATRSVVALLEGIGVKNYRGRSISRWNRENAYHGDEKTWDVPSEPDKIDRLNRWESSWEREKYSLIPGRRFDLLERVKKARDDYSKAQEEWYRSKENALREYREYWEGHHPFPTSPDLQALIESDLISLNALERNVKI